MNERKIRILAVDHNALLREGISLLVWLHADLEIVCSVSSADEAVQGFKNYRPDVILMDLDLPAGAGISAIREIFGLDPSAYIIGLLTYEWDTVGPRALQAGAQACLTKDRLNDDLVSLIRDGSGRSAGE